MHDCTSLSYWPVLDDALRAAAFERNVRVKVLASWWKYSLSSLTSYLRSLAALNGTVSARNCSVSVEVVP